jgi:hypothetical protein
MTNMEQLTIADARKLQSEHRLPLTVYIRCRDIGVKADQQKTIFMYVLGAHIEECKPINVEYCQYVVNLVQLLLDRATHAERLYAEAYPGDPGVYLS